MIVDTVWFWTPVILLGVVMSGWTVKKDIPLVDRKKILMPYITIVIFLVGMTVNISLTGLFLTSASESGFSWYRILDYLFIGVLLVLIIYMGRKLIQQKYLGDIGYLLISFSTGVLVRTFLEVL